MIQEIDKVDYNDRIRELATGLANAPQEDMPVTEMFAPGVYYREIFMPAGTFVIGHIHKTEHFNIITEGAVSVLINGEITHIHAPHTFVSEPGVAKVLYTHKDTKWITIHPSTETDSDKLLDSLIEDSDIYKKNQKYLSRLKELEAES